MKKIIILAFAFTAICATSCKSKKAASTSDNQIQEKPVEESVAPEKPKTELDKRLARQEEMYTQLGISENQKEEFRAIETKYAGKMREIRNSNGGDREALRAAMEPLMEQKQNEIKELLSADQFAKYTSLLQEMRMERRQGRPGGKKR